MRNFDSSAPGAHWLRPKLATILFSALQSVACEAQGEWGRGTLKVWHESCMVANGGVQRVCTGRAGRGLEEKEVLSCEHGAASGRQRPLHG